MEMDFDLEEIILYLNANEPTGKYCKNIENLKNKLLKAQEQEEILRIIFETNIDIEQLKYRLRVKDDDVYLHYKYDFIMTREKFNVLKRWIENEKSKEEFE